MEPILRPYTPKSPSSSSFTTKKRPNRPRPGSPKLTSEASLAHAEELKRFVKRQRTEEDEETWTAAAVEELTKLEDEMVEKGSGGFSPAVEPYDDSEVVEVGGDDASYDLSDGGLADPAKAQDLEQYLTPTILPFGPNATNPMTAKPNAMVFFHIPLIQAYTSPIDVTSDGRRLLLTGERREFGGSSKTDGGFWDQAILAQGELIADEKDAVVDEFWDGEHSVPTTGRPEVKVLAHGHCHNNSVSFPFSR